MTAVTFHASPMCPTCGDEGVLAIGDLAPLRPATSLAPAPTNGVEAAIPLNASIASEISAAQPFEDEQETASGPVEDLLTGDGLLTDLSRTQETSNELLIDVSGTDDGLVTDGSGIQETDNGLLTDVPGIQETDDSLLTDLSESSVAVVENVPGTQETDDGLVTDVSEMEKAENLQPALVASNGSRGSRFRNWLKKFLRVAWLRVLW